MLKHLSALQVRTQRKICVILSLACSNAHSHAIPPRASCMGAFTGSFGLRMQGKLNSKLDTPLNNLPQ